MALITVPKRTTKSQDMALAKKSGTVKKSVPTVKGGGSIISRIQNIQAMVETKLGKYRDRYIVIRDEETLIKYLDKCIESGIISLDTETTGLDPLLDEIAGICIYTPGEKGAYIPINHISYITQEKVDNQLSVEFLREQFTRVYDNDLDSIMFNAAFDIRVMRNCVGVKNIYCTWDTYLAARCLNENEPVNKLKPLHNKYCLDGQGDAFTFDDLFKGIPFTMIPIKTGYLYAARDPEITYELYMYQKQYLREDIDREDLQDVYWVFKNIEMPCIDAVANLEDTGVKFDFEHNARLKEKYHKLLDEKMQGFYDTCKPYSSMIEAYKKANVACKLEDPINIASTQQLAILLYDIIGLPLFYDKKKKAETRSTSEEALRKMDHPVANAILEYREFSTLVSTFIDKLPECVNPNDGRIHCKFNQYGADTGRFSSSEPNLQNIPSHTKDIRPMFKATDGYVFLSADYSQQEIKGMAQMCGDEGMIEAFRQGKDFYAEIASVAFGYPYEECLEFRPDGTTNPAGKERRAQAKSILLGINYGRGAASIAEQLGCDKKKAEKIKEDVFKGFPAIAEFERQSYDMVNSLGYVTTLWGRKRRLPSMLLPDYTFRWSDEGPVDDDLLDFDEDVSSEVPEAKQRYYRNKLAKAYFRDKQKIFKEANAEGIWIIDNTKDKDYTKVVNARIQGTAADMTKLAMIALNKDERLKELGFRMLIQVHDEIIAECPKENAKEVVERFSKVMSEAPGERFVVPISCDVEVTTAWYGEKVEI